jgi:polyphosphate kinase
VSGSDGLLHFAPIEAVVAAHVETLFPGMEVLSVHPFRVTRNADVLRDEEEAEDLLEMISAEVRERRFAPVVRLEVERRCRRPTVTCCCANSCSSPKTSVRWMACST